MKNLKLSILIILLFFTRLIYAQVGVKVRQLPYELIHSPKDKAMPYQYVREADIMWSKIVWERVELSEKQNQILGLPAEPVRDSKSLIDVLLDGILTGGISAYSGMDDFGHEFSNPIPEKEVRERMGAKTQVYISESLEGYDTTIVDEPIKSRDVVSYLVKEVWFFDKQRSVLDVRVIGLCPIRKEVEYTEGLEEEGERIKYIRAFWVYYPEVRPYLAKSPVYWEQTDVMNITYDDIFQKRLFSGYYFMVSNPKNRALVDYKLGLDVLVEAEKIKQEMFNFEQDLWSY